MVSPGGSVWVSATTRSATSTPSGATARAASCRAKAHQPFFHKAFLPAPDAGLRRASPPHDLVGPTPSADRRTISARHTCFWAALRFPIRPCKRRRTDGETVMEIPARITRTRTRRHEPQFPLENSMQVLSTTDAGRCRGARCRSQGALGRRGLRVRLGQCGAEQKNLRRIIDPEQQTKERAGCAEARDRTVAAEI